MKKKLSDSEIASIMASARTYVAVQLETMGRYGCRPTLTAERYEQLVRDCAKPALAIAK